MPQKTVLATGRKALPGETQEARYYRVTILRSDRSRAARRRTREQGHQDPSALCGGKRVCTPSNLQPISAPCLADLTSISAAFGTVGLTGRL